jgi:hypothetical protein
MRGWATYGYCCRARLDPDTPDLSRSVTGPGYALDRECHYDIDVTPDNHLEFTFRAEGANRTGLGSATNKGNRTYWKESLDRLS